MSVANKGDQEGSVPSKQQIIHSKDWVGILLSSSDKHWEIFDKDLV